MERRLDRLKGASYLKALDPESIYSARDIVNQALEKGIFEADDEPEKAVARFRANAKELDHPGDGKVVGANGRMVDGYYGARWKLLLPEAEMSYEGWRGCHVVLEELAGDAPSPLPVHANMAILAKLNLLESRLDDVRRHIALVKNLGGLIPALGWLIRARWRRLSLAGGAGIALILFALQHDMSLLLPQTQANRIAVLFCQQDTLVLPYAVSDALNTAAELSTLPLARSAKIAAKYKLCQRPEEETLAAIADEMHAPFLLWGQFSRNKKGRSFSGLLYQKEIGAVEITATTRDGLHLPDAVAEACFAKLGIFPKQPLSTVHFHSRNESANLIYSEAQLLYEEEDIAAALKLFRRAAVFDPDFLQARIRHARCLTLTGEYAEAADVLTQLETGSHMPDDLKLRMYVDKVNNLFWTQQYDQVELILIPALGLKEAGDPNCYSILLDIAARASYEQGEMTRVQSFVRELQSMAEAFPNDQKLRVRLLRLQAYLAEATDPDQSVTILLQALEITKDHNLSNRQYDVLEELTRVTAKNQLAEMEIALNEITLAKPSLTRALGEIVQHKCRYLLGQLQLASGEPFKGETNFIAAIPPLATSGHVDLVANARLHLVQLYLDQKRFLEAKAMLEPLEDRFDQLRPRIQLTVLDRAFRLAYFQEKPEEAIAKLKQRTQIARDIQSPALKKCYFDQGVFYSLTGDPNSTEKFYLKALDSSNPTDQIFQLSKQNLLALYRSQNQPEKIKLLIQRLGRNLE